MRPRYYIGLDVHKQKISYCVKEVGGKVYAEGWIPATRFWTSGNRKCTYYNPLVREARSKDFGRNFRIADKPSTASQCCESSAAWIVWDLGSQSVFLYVNHACFSQTVTIRLVTERRPATALAP